MHFDYPGSTHGFRYTGHRGTVISARQVAHEGGGGLQATVRKLHKKGEVRLFVKTYLRPEELSANYYGATFSPKIYPGQRLRARLYLPEGAPQHLRASPYVWDDNHGERHQAAGTKLVPGRWHDLSFQVPILHNACLSEAGIVLRNLSDPWSGSVIIDYLDWDGSARYSCDFARERAEQGAASQWTFLRGCWRLDGGAFHGSGSGTSEAYSGDIDWRDLTLVARLKPLVGDYHNIAVRVQGALRSYGLGLAPGHKLTLYKNDRGYQPVASVDFQWHLHETYSLALTARGSRLLAQVNGEPVMEWVDEEAPFLWGQIGLSNFAGCHTRYEYIEIS
jgi:hypothetical protein